MIQMMFGVVIVYNDSSHLTEVCLVKKHGQVSTPFLTNHSPKVVNITWIIHFQKHPVKTKRIVVGVNFLKSQVVRVTEKKVIKSILDYIYIKIMLNRDCIECSNEIQTN